VKWHEARIDFRWADFARPESGNASKLVEMTSSPREAASLRRRDD
jgi:hypothetical protein